MSYESNDERIERLEENFAVLLSTQKGILESIKILRAEHVDFHNLISTAKKDHLALFRFIATNPLIVDESARQGFRDQASRLETDIERVEAMVARLGKVIQNPEVEAPPPDEPSSPGPAT